VLVARLRARPDDRRSRILAIVDNCTRECLALIADISISGVRVARELDRIIACRGRPDTVTSDNGAELTSNAILKSVDERGGGWQYIQPGKPQQNAFSFCSDSRSDARNCR